MNTNESYKILVCDDDQAIVDAISIFLKSEGYGVLAAYDGLQALKVLSENTVQLVIMDVMMPKLDGLKAVMKLRETQNVPVIILSAKTEDTDKIIGLNVGADDYIEKPFNMLLLLARVRAHLRRFTALGSIEKRTNVCRTGGLVLDDEQKQVYVDDEPVKLTPMEYKIIHLLINNLNRVFTMDEIYEAVWNEPAYNHENTVAVHIRRIREKIEYNPREPKYLKVVWGIGYKIEKL